MPKTPTVKSKKPASPPSIPPKPARSITADIDKEAVIQILLAKLGDNKSFDWYGLSQKLNVSTVGGKQKTKGKAKEEEVLNGTELRDVYTDIILPAIRRGVMPWEDTSSDASSSSSTTLEIPPLKLPSNKRGGLKQDAKVKHGKNGKKKADVEEVEMEGEEGSEYEEEEAM